MHENSQPIGWPPKKELPFDKASNNKVLFYRVFQINVPLGDLAIVSKAKENAI